MGCYRGLQKIKSPFTGAEDSTLQSLTKIYTGLLPLTATLTPGWEAKPIEDTVASLMSPDMMLDAPIMLNIYTAFLCWWSTPAEKRTVLRVRPASAEYLQGVSISFTPSAPPPVWGGNAIVIESTEGHTCPLVGSIWSIAAYMHFSPLRNKKELCVVWLEGESAGFASFPCGKKIEATTPDVDLESLFIFGDIELGASTMSQESALSALKMVLAASYYADTDLPNVEVVSHKGPKAAGKGAGKTYLWRYQNLLVRPATDFDGTKGGTLDKDGKLLSPVVVRPHIRMIADKAVVIDAHASHRWKTTDAAGTIGTKKRI